MFCLPNPKNIIITSNSIFVISDDDHDCVREYKYQVKVGQYVQNMRNKRFECLMLCMYVNTFSGVLCNFSVSPVKKLLCCMNIRGHVQLFTNYSVDTSKIIL